MQTLPASGLRGERSLPLQNNGMGCAGVDRNVFVHVHDAVWERLADVREHVERDGRCLSFVRVQSVDQNFGKSCASGRRVHVDNGVSERHFVRIFSCCLIGMRISEKGTVARAATIDS
jgi:hypothetical protein